MNTDGSNVEVVAEGEYKNINITSNYTYFHDYSDSGNMYQTPTNGTVSVSVFSPIGSASE
jgi:hypothetical protein